MIHFLVWLVVSGIAGFVASKIINKSGSGLPMDVLIGIVGGIVGGEIVAHIPVLSGLGAGGFLSEVVVAILGAMLVIWLWNLIFRRNALPQRN